MSNDKYYQQIIDIVVNDDGDVDWRGIALELAKKYPQDFVAAATPGEPEWMKTVREHLTEGMLASAIKEWRANTGNGLKEAKSACEALDEWKKFKEREDDGWMDWYGTNCGEDHPTLSKDVRVRVRFRDGIEDTGQAGGYRWDHSPSENTCHENDIVAYKVEE